MADNVTLPIDASELFSERVTMTVKVRGMRRFALKAKIASLLVDLARRVLGCPLEVSFEEASIENRD